MQCKINKKKTPFLEKDKEMFKIAIKSCWGQVQSIISKKMATELVEKRRG
jgi:hypothetical protein